MYEPSTIAPSGRIRNPAPNVASDNISELNSLSLGKNVCAMAAA
jgi:hypothetical protein